MGAKTGIGIVGTGDIFREYVQGLRAFPNLEIVACADIDADRVQERTAQHHIPHALAPEELLAREDVDIVVNLTPPKAHAAVNQAAIAAGKHVYTEKPFALNPEDGRQILAAAEAAGVRVGCAPDTFLGGGLQTCRRVVDDGWIGRPVAATAFMLGHGPERWHPNPFFFYKEGGGPLFDMGPYYLTALIFLLGAIRAVDGAATRGSDERVARSEAHYGARIAVDIPTHVTAALHFEAGPLATLITSFDVWASEVPRIEIYGTLGTLSVPDPNQFGGIVRLRRHDQPDWHTIPHTHAVDRKRGLGVADMAAAIRHGRSHRASGALGMHVLEAMSAILAAAGSGQRQTLTTRVDRPDPLPETLLPEQLDP